MTLKPLEITELSSSSVDENGSRHHAEQPVIANKNNNNEKKKPSTFPTTMRSYDDDDEAEPSSAFMAMSTSDDEIEDVEDEEPALHGNGDDNDNDQSPPAAVDSQHPHNEDHNDHKTTVWQTFVHLVKGYIGPGCLSLPWAMSQLGIIPGVLICFALAAWSSYNCWIVVKLKRKLMAGNNAITAGGMSCRQLTYPDVAGCMYGPRAQGITALSIGTQQLAICTVFFSFCGDNLQAVLNGLIQSHYEDHPGFSHAAVITFCFPVVLALAMIPDLKGLASASAFGTILLLVGFGILGVLVMQEFDDRPGYVPATGFPYFNTAQVPLYPLAACALLYSYEGICLILPIESAMKKPEHFESTFCVAMFLAAMTFSIVASVAVYVFGAVSDGSLTAFLLERYEANSASKELVILLWIANAAVSLSVLVTFPLQLFPALELVQEALDGGRGPGGGARFAPVQTDEVEAGTPSVVAVREQNGAGAVGTNGFAPVFTIEDNEGGGREQNGAQNHDRDKQSDCHDAEDDARVTVENEAELFADEPEPANNNSPNDTNALEDDSSTSFGGSLWLRFALVIFTYVIAIVVPNVQSLIALAGALAGSLTALILPPALAMADGGRVFSVISLILGSIFGIVGTVAALTDIVKG